MHEGLFFGNKQDAEKMTTSELLNIQTLPYLVAGWMLLLALAATCTSTFAHACCASSKGFDPKLHC